MPIKDSLTAFGTVSRVNHWLTAIIVIVMLGIGMYFEDMPRGDEKVFWMKLHISIGATAFLFIVFRIYWRIKQGFPAPFPQDRRLQILTHGVHDLLLLGLAVLIISGPITVWSGGRDVGFFGLFAIPSPTGEIKTLHEIFEGIHVFTANLILFIVILHVLGAVKHLVMDRNEFMGRMIGRSR